MAIEKKCTWCGKTVLVPPSKSSKNNFCNRECYLAFHSKDKKEFTCEVCGKTFRPRNMSNANRFCSRECYDKQHNIKNKLRECPTCKKMFEAKSSEDKYCSRECYDKDRHMPKGKDHWNWQGGISVEHDHRDSQEYKKWRSSVYARDNYCCTRCGSKIRLNAHHIKSWKNFPELRYDVDNGITLCERCHIKHHQQHGYDDSQGKTV